MFRACVVAVMIGGMAACVHHPKELPRNHPANPAVPIRDYPASITVLEPDAATKRTWRLLETHSDLNNEHAAH